MKAKKIHYIIGGLIVLIIAIIIVVSAGRGYEKKETETETTQPEQTFYEAPNYEAPKQVEKINTFLEEYKNIPLPAGAILKEHFPYQVETSTMAQQDERFSYEVNLPQEEVMTFYRKNLPRFGWTVDYIEGNVMFYKYIRKVLFIGVDKKSQNESILTIMIGK